MTWFKVDDGIVTHEKFAALAEGPCRADAIALWTMAGAWSSHALKNGLVPRGVVTSLGFDPRAPGELVRVGLWEVAESGAHEFHDWADYNPSAAQVQAKRKAAAVRKAKHRAKLSELPPELEPEEDVGESRRDCESVTVGVTLEERSRRAHAARDRDLSLLSSSDLEIARTPNRDVVPDSRPRQLACGLEWYCRVTGRISAGCRRKAADEAAFIFIGSRPEEERKRAEANVRSRIADGSDAWLAQRISEVAADHFQQFWARYLENRQQPKPIAKAAPPANPYHHFGARKMVQDPDCPVLMISVEERDAKLARRAAEGQVAHA